MGIQKGEVLAFIPARGNSKGLPRKNSRLLAGKPLLAWSVEAARKAQLITRVVVSTEDEELAAIAKDYGAEVPFLRPTHLSHDDALINQALEYTLTRLAQETGYEPECIVELYPTHPFRTPVLLDVLVQKLLDGYSEVVTVREVPYHPERLTTTDAQGGLRLLSGLAQASGPVRAYRRYGQFNGWRAGRNPDACFKGYAHVIMDPLELIDIDYPEDFLLAEQVIMRNMYDFG